MEGKEGEGNGGKGRGREWIEREGKGVEGKTAREGGGEMGGKGNKKRWEEREKGRGLVNEPLANWEHSVTNTFAT